MPPATRRTRARAAGGEEETAATPTVAASTHATEGPPKKKARHDSPQAEALLADGDATVAPSDVVIPSSPSPASLVDANSLSVIMTFLNSRGFSAASKICRAWASAARVRTAWPQFDLARCARHALQQSVGPFGEPRARRRLRLRSEEEIERATKSAIYSKAPSVLLSFHQPHPEDEDDSGNNSGPSLPLAATELLATMRDVTSVEWATERMDTASFTRFATAVQDRLLRLALRCSDVYSTPRTIAKLGLFNRLQVLSISFLPDSEQLQQLTELRYLSLPSRGLDAHLIRAIRFLSTRHQLKGVTICGNEATWMHEVWMRLTSDDGADPNPLPPTALEQFSCHARLRETELELICGMPQLQALDCSITYARELGEAHESRYRCFSPQLRALTLTIMMTMPNRWDFPPDDGSSHLSVLALCTGLRSLELFIDNSTNKRPALDLAHFLPEMKQLEELSLGGSRVCEDSWSTLAQLRELIRLTCAISPPPDLSLIVPHLAGRQQFAQLTISVDHGAGETFQLPSVLLPVVALCPAWRDLHVQCLGGRGPNPWDISQSNHALSTPDAEAIAAASRFRVHRHAIDRSVLVYRVATRESGRRVWRDLQAPSGDAGEETEEEEEEEEESEDEEERAARRARRKERKAEKKAKREKKKARK